MLQLLDGEFGDCDGGLEGRVATLRGCQMYAVRVLSTVRERERMKKAKEKNNFGLLLFFCLICLFVLTNGINFVDGYDIFLLIFQTFKHQKLLTDFMPVCRYEHLNNCKKYSLAKLKHKSTQSYINSCMYSTDSWKCVSIWHLTNFGFLLSSYQKLNEDLSAMLGICHLKLGI